MATRNAVFPQMNPANAAGNIVIGDYEDIILVEWSGVLNGDVGNWIVIGGGWTLVLLQADGTAGAGLSLSWEGTIERITSPTILCAIDGYAGSAIGPITALPSQKAVAQTPLQIRPHVTAGDGTTSLVCRALLRQTGG